MHGRYPRTHTQVKVAVLPKCDFCGKDAKYDGKLNFGSSWAYMCEEDFKIHGIGLGLGRGQELILE